MSLDYLFPINKSHAIQNVLFVVEWQGELTEQALDTVQKLAPDLKSYFPEHMIQKSVKIKIDPTAANDQLVQPSEGGAIDGVVFQRKSKFGNVISQLHVSRTNCVILFNEYERWDPTLKSVMRYYKTVLPVIMKQQSINKVALQYTDMFTWKDDPVNLDLKEVFSSDSPYLVPNVFSQEGLWHCHHGYLVEKFENLDGKCLDNININMVDNQGDRGINIITTHQFILNNPLRLSSKTYLQSIEEVQNKLHSHNKTILNKLLSVDVCKKISLVNSGGD